jgi:tyrosyl-tRNA synthetase
MQGYDSYFMNTDIQLGGTDQTFNMQAGRTLQKDIRKKQSFIITTTILEGTDGRKMSKSWGNAIWLDDTSEDIYAKVMAITDELIIQYYTLATNVPLNEVKEAELALKNGEHPMHIKKELAFIITKELTNLKEAEAAKAHFENIVQKDEMPKDILTISVQENITINELLTTKQLAKSKTDAKRLIAQGGVKLDEVTITDPDMTVRSGILRVGKRTYRKLEIQE